MVGFVNESLATIISSSNLTVEPERLYFCNVLIYSNCIKKASDKSSVVSEKGDFV